MKYRRLGDAGMKVSAVALGAWINFEGKVPDVDVRRIVDTAYESGINFFDIADAYGHGSAEKQVGGLLQRFPRHTLVISTKLFWPMSDDVNDQGLSRKHIMESIDKSLQRLETDYVDIYFCHRPDPETPVLETARAMNDLIRRGKILYWGTSEWPVEKLTEAYEICERYGFDKPQAEQPEYSMFHREPVEGAVLPLAESHGTGLVAWSPLAMGLLTGKYDAGVAEGTRFARQVWAKGRLYTPENVEKVRRLKPIAEDMGITRVQLALAWALRHSGVSSVITGATQSQQIEESIGAADVVLSSDVVAAIETILTS